MMREYVIKQLRERSCVRGKQKTWISELADDQLYDLFLRLRNNETAKSIARHIQKAWGVLPESSVHSVSQGILKFKKRIAHLLLTPPSENISQAPTTGEEIDQLDELEQMERIAQMQRDRIKKMMAEEEEIGFKHSSMSREIHALTALTKAITKAKEWEMVHEGLDPVKRRKLERKKQRIKSGVDAMMDYLGPDGRDEMIEAAERLMEGLEKDSMILEIDEGGNYRLKNPKEAPEPETSKNESEP